MCLGFVKWRRGGRRFAEENLLMAVAAGVGEGDVRLRPNVPGLQVSILHERHVELVTIPGHFQFHGPAIQGGFQGGVIELQSHVLNRQ